MTQKKLKYDGRSSWLSFKQKINSYRKVYHWDDQECRDYLNWCLEGKALDYFTIETHMGQMYSYKEIMRMMESLAPRISPSKAKFQQASKRAGETLED